ncbi:MAG: cellulose biosynthesis protein BcsE [Pseudomonadota bacterium]
MLDEIRSAWNMAGLAQSMPALRVPIEGLPDGASQFYKGACYSISTVSEQLSVIFIQAMLRNAVLTGLKGCLLLVDSTGQSVLLQQLAMPSSWLSFRMGQQEINYLLHHGTAGLLSQLEAAGFTPGSILLLVDPESHIRSIELARGHFAKELMLWTRTWHHTVVGIRHLSGSYNAYEPNLIQQMGGAAQLTMDWGRYHWRIRHWQQPNGAIIQHAVLDVRYNETAQRLETPPQSVDDATHRPFRAADTDRIIVAREVAEHDRHLPPDWEIVDDPYDFEEYLTGASAPSIILAFSRNSQFEALARLVTQIRLFLGRGVRLMLRETDVRIRAYQEHILQVSGLNLVIHPYERTSSLISLIQALDESYPQSSLDPVAFERLLEVTRPLPLRGYLPARIFCRTIMEGLERSSAFAIDHRLLHIQVLSGVSVNAALESFEPAQQGDLITVYEGQLYVFLFGGGHSSMMTLMLESFPVDVARCLHIEASWYQTTSIIEQAAHWLATWEQAPPTPASSLIAT